MKIFLDDIVVPQPNFDSFGPDLSWHLVTTYDECIELLKNRHHPDGKVECISLDYDLSHTDGHHSGMDVLNYLSDEVLHGFIVPEILIHSMHPKAVEMMAKANALNSMMRRMGKNEHTKSM